MKVQDMALKNCAPIIGIYDAGGARIQEGVAALGGYAEVFQRNVLASGVIPQISIIMGPCAGGDVYSPAMTDFIFMVRDTSYMFVTGPDVVKTVTNETVTSEQLGGASVHTTKSSIADAAYDNDIDTLMQVRRLIDFLPQSNTAALPEIECYQSVTDPDMSLDTIIPANANKPYDVKELIQKVADEGISSRSRLASPRTSSAASAGSRARLSVSSPTSPWCLPVCWTATPRERQRVSSASAIASIFRSSPLSTSPASCRAPRRNMAG